MQLNVEETNLSSANQSVSSTSEVLHVFLQLSRKMCKYGKTVYADVTI